MTTLGFDATPLLGQRSGVGHYTKRLLSAIMASRPDWIYHFYSNRPLGALDDGLLGAVEIESYFPASRWLWMQTALPQIIRRDNPDLCHFTNALAPVNLSRPYVITIHDASLFLYRRYHPWSRIAAMRLLLPAVARRASAVIVPSFIARRDLLETLDLAPECVHVIYEAAPEWFCRVTDEAQSDALRRKYNLPEEFVLFLGTLEPRKNLEGLIRSLAQLYRRGRRIPLVLVGQQGWHMEGHRGRPGLQALVGNLGLEPYIHYLGYVPTADLPGLLSLSTIFAFPSLYEGFGLPAVEAMACGASVLTSRNTAMAEICGDAVHFIDPYNVDDIANGLELLLADADYRRQLSQRALCQAKRYSWKRAAEETIAVYNKVLATPEKG
jgi:glycosyltransferase involved in cell wall biosynthesis